MESVILSSPYILCGYAVALVLSVVTIVRKSCFALMAISLFIFAATSTYALVSGATLPEVSVCAVVFFIIYLIPAWRGRGDK